ncbi:MAG TPA: hypothetical protein VGS12_07435 [Caulobacteraceae bacterium]|nr:hypothetical protein [Caulobacteraceae bacterium]
MRPSLSGRPVGGCNHGPSARAAAARLSPASAITAALLAACASTHGPTPSAPVAASPIEARTDRAEALLERGDAKGARREVVAALAARTGDPGARLLLDQIDMSPHALLGDRNFRHLAAPGETFDTLAQRYLGNRRLFYALARYNGFAAGDTPIAGRVILIPGHPPAPAGPAPAVASARRRAPPQPQAATPPPTPARTDPAGAERLRAQALVALDGGRADEAALLLARAQALDPSNAAIRDELGRAQRIEVALHGR